MFKKKRSMIGAFIIALILTLATTVVGLALWNETLIVEGRVETGKVDVELLFESATDNELNLDVAQCSAKTGDHVGGEATQGGGGPNNRLSITVKNGYPGYECRVIFGVFNKGSIPVILNQPDFTKLPPEGTLTTQLEECYRNDTFLGRGETASCAVRVKVGPDAEQGQAYRFEAGVEARQFNAPK
jgi:hypothetical protein